MATIGSGGTPQTAEAAQSFQAASDGFSAAGINANKESTEDSIAADVALSAANSAAKKPGKVQVP